jgi:hypothetical protein
LIKNLEISGQPIPKELEDMASHDDHYNQSKIMAKHGLVKGNSASQLLQQALKRGQTTLRGLGYGKDKDKKSLKPEVKEQYKKDSNTMLQAQKNNTIISQFLQEVTTSVPEPAHQNILPTFQTASIKIPVHQGVEGITFGSVSQIASENRFSQAAPITLPEQPTTVRMLQNQGMKFQPAGAQNQMITGTVGQRNDTASVRDQIASEYSNRIKSNMYTQYASKFVSAGSMQASHSLPTIVYRKMPPEVKPKKQEEEYEDYSYPNKRSKFSEGPNDHNTSGRKTKFSDGPTSKSSKTKDTDFDDY